MVFWCKACSVFLGLHDPIEDWSVDQNGFCHDCLQKQLAVLSATAPARKEQSGSTQNKDSLADSDGEQRKAPSGSRIITRATLREVRGSVGSAWPKSAAAR